LGGFIGGVFAAYLAGGLALMLGPAELLRGVLSGVEIPGADAAALVTGGALILVAVAVWTRREHLARVQLPHGLTRPGSALALGALVTVLDLPTAFPYFGAIAVIVSADVPAAAQLILLVAFNVLYVLPLALVPGAHLAFGARGHAMLARIRGAVERIAAPLLVVGAGGAGVALVVRGAAGVLK
jgi:cytochrome c biogenesis protein CcdA